MAFASAAVAVPQPPLNIGAEFVGEGIRISWEHPSEELEFNIYRGSSVENTEVIATVSEKSFIDFGTTPGHKYVYLVTSFDGNVESSAVGHVEVTPIEQGEVFSVSLVKPVEKSFEFGEETEFVLRVESSRFEDLKYLRAELVNNELGVRESFVFDSDSKQFRLLARFPERRAESVTVSYIIQAGAVLGEEQLSDSLEVSIILTPASTVDVGALAVNLFVFFGPAIFVLFLLSGALLVGMKWYLHRKTQLDAIRLEMLGVLRERTVWRYDMMRRRVSQQQYSEKERELLGKQRALEMKLGIGGKKGVAVSKNPFEGYNLQEVEEIYRIVKSIGPKKKGHTPDSLRTWLVGRGKTERVAKKAAELIFKKK